MDARVQLERVVYCLIVVGMLMTWPDHARSQGVSDVFSSSDGYDYFAVGVAHRWYDKYSTEAKEKSSHCLSVLSADVLPRSFVSEPFKDCRLC